MSELKTKAFNGKTAARIVLVSPIANENIKGVNAADLNNPNIKLYTAVIQQVASSQDVGYANTYSYCYAHTNSDTDADPYSYYSAASANPCFLSAEWLNA